MTMTLEKLLTDYIALQVNHIYFINKVTRFYVSDVQFWLKKVI